MTARTFPIMGMGDPKPTVPWEMVEPHEEQALRNHGQTLDRLASRGGLDPVELLAVLKGRPYPWRMKNDAGMAMAEIEAMRAAFVERWNLMP